MTVDSHIESLAEVAEHEVHRRTDRMSCGLLIFQWLAAIGLACWLSPKTWAGTVSSPHIHLWAAIFLGGAINALPLWLILRRPARSTTRHAVAIAQMLTGALLIHLTRLHRYFPVLLLLAEPQGDVGHRRTPGSVGGHQRDHRTSHLPA